MPRAQNAIAKKTVQAGSDRFGIALRTWRRLNNIKQAKLADLLGVSQPTITRWEQGADMPTPARMKQIRDMMVGAMRDELALQSLFIRRQAGVRALFDFDSLKMIAISEGFRKIWPDSSSMLDFPLRDHLVDEANMIVNDPDLRCEILDGWLGLASGVSDRQTDLQVDEMIRHRWHICFRRYGPRLIADMVYEPCDAEIATGITELVRFDEMGDIRAL